MNNRILLAAALGLTVLTAACNRNEIAFPDNHTREGVFIGEVTGTISSRPAVRSTFAEESVGGDTFLSTYWAAGDRITVMDGSASAEYVCSSAAEASTSAPFTGSGSFDTSGGLWAVYPSSSLVSQGSGNMKVRVDATVSMDAEGSFGQWGANDLKLGYGAPGAAATAIEFRNVLALLRVNLKLAADHGISFAGGETVSSVAVTALGGEALCGEFSVAQGASMPSLVPSSPMSEIVCATQPGTVLSSSSALTLYFHVAPGTYSTLRFTIRTSSLRTIVRDIAIDGPLAGNCFYDVNLTSVRSASPYTVSSNNVFGVVRDSEGNPLQGVVVSDGYVVTVTGSDGFYEMDSQKANGYVFISQPDGYEVPLDGVFPRFWQALTGDAATGERHDFTLTASDNGECVFLALGDFHLCNRNALHDLLMFRRQVDELKSVVRDLRSRGKKVYGLTLGDMTWDIYWDSSSGYAGCNFDLAAYRSEMNSDFEGLTFPVWHTIGNHDYDYSATGDWDTALPYKRTLGPTYYSLNAGGWHIVSLDNVICRNDGTSGGRSSSAGLDADVRAWLAADIARIPAGMPVLVSMHEPTYLPTNATGSYSRASYASELLQILGSRKVHLVSGHSHTINNVPVSSAVYEHNAGSLCATWWWTGRHCIDYWGGTGSLSDTFHIGRDGTPGGYTVYELSSGTVEWQYRGFGLDAGRQFKTYDRNSFVLNAAGWCPNATSARKTAFEKLAAKGDGQYSYAAAAGSSSVPANLVYINVWNWDPSWSISVRENGVPLTVTALTGAYDPMHIAAYSAARYNGGSDVTSSFVTCATQHMFRVQASGPSTTLTVTVTDRFGNVYTEEMTRPKAFGVNWN